MIKILHSTLYILHSRNGGQLLIEAMIGLGIAMVGLLGIVGLVSHSVSLNKVVSDQFTATYLASEGIEIVKNMIDSNIIQGNSWNSGLTEQNDFNVDYKSLSLRDIPFESDRELLFDSVNRLYSYQRGGATPFIRTIHITPVMGGDEIKVNSIVHWASRGGASFDVNLEDHFFNWRPKP